MSEAAIVWVAWTAILAVTVFGLWVTTYYCLIHP